MRLNLQAVKEAVRGDSTVIQVEAQVHAPASSNPRKRASKEPAAAPKGQFTNKGVDVTVVQFGLVFKYRQ